MPSHEEKDLTEHIWANPDDDVPRLVYADWLMERGDPRGEFIRLQVESAALPEGNPRKLEYERRAAAVMHAHRLEWTPEVSPKFEWRFVRGLPAAVKLAAVDLPEFVDALAEVRGLETFELNFHGVSDTDVAAWSRVFSHRVFETLRSLRLTWHVPQVLVPRLVEQPWLQRLESLQLSWTMLHEDAWRALGDAGPLRHLQTFDIGLSGATDESVQALGDRPWPKLKRLRLAANQLGTAACEALVRPGVFPHLEELDLSGNRIGKRGGVLLTGAEWFQNLRSLDLSRLVVGDETCRAIANAAPRHLAWLGLSQSRCSETALAELERALPGTAVVTRWSYDSPRIRW